MESNQDIFIEKLDNFIRKYYQVQILRGILLTFIFLLAIYLILSVFEYHLYLSAQIKTLLLVVGFCVQILVLIFFIFLPLRGLLNKSSRITYRKAISFISAHYPDLEDRLLNTYELNEKASYIPEENTLLIASINKRISSLKLLSFRQSISFKAAYIYLKYLCGILLLALFFYFIFPNFYSTTSNRLIHFNDDFKAPADFEFILESDLFAEKGADYLLRVTTVGKFEPKSIDLIYGAQNYLMVSNQSGVYTYLFRNLNTDIQFFFQSGKTKSINYNLHLKSRPTLDKLEIKINPPLYTNLASRIEKQIGDVSIPLGSELEWFIETYDTDTLGFHFVNKDSLIIKAGSRLRFTDYIFESDTYEISLANKEYTRSVYARYQIEVLPDLFPSIDVSVQPDSMNASVYYFKGVIQDDYGFSKLHFSYQLQDGEPKSLEVPIQKKLNHQEFYFAFDFSSVNIPEGSRLQYYFEIFDNDAINKPKSTKSNFLNYYLPNGEQVFELNSHIQDRVTSKIERGREISRSIEQDVYKLQKSLLDNNTDQWQHNQMFNEIKTQKKQLENLLKEIKKDNAHKNQLMKAAGLQDALLLDKQKKIEDLMAKMMDDELKTLFEEFNKLADELDRDKINELGNQLKMSMSDFQKQIDRNLQLLQRYEIELGVKQISSRIEKIAEEQKQLSEFKRRDKELTISKQIVLKMKWERIERDLDELIKTNLEIDKPYGLDEFNDEKEDVNNNMQDGIDQLRGNKLDKAEESMKNSSQKQLQMAQKLSSVMSQSMSMQIGIDINMLNKLLSNLIDFSFKQEDLILKLKKINDQDPLYINIIDKQGLLKEEYQLLKDSLLSLSSRVPQIVTLIGNRIFNLENLLNKSIESLTNRRVYQARITQQQSMTEINELAVFLSEALKQIMEQMANGMPGNEIGDKKGKQASFSGMKAQQESLKKTLEQMIQSIKEGAGKSNNQGEKLGKYLQQQEMFREKMNNMIQQGEHGEQTDKILREVMRMMEQTERETVNFSIGNQTLSRQNQIISRLLEAENASHEQGVEKGRESKSVSNHKLSEPKEIFKSKLLGGEFDDLLNDSNVKLIEYYNKIYLDYLIRLNNSK